MDSNNTTNTAYQQMIDACVDGVLADNATDKERGEALFYYNEVLKLSDSNTTTTAYQQMVDACANVVFSDNATDKERGEALFYYAEVMKLSDSNSNTSLTGHQNDGASGTGS